jgi:hypothetical protein
MAMSLPGGSQGNPGADQWQLYFVTLGSARSAAAIPREEVDRLWSLGEQRSTRNGYRVAGDRGTSPDLPAVSFALTDPANPYPLARASDPSGPPVP